MEGEPGSVRRPGFVLGLTIGLMTAIIVGLVVYIVTSDRTRGVPSPPAASALASSTPIPSASPTPVERTPAEVSEPFNGSKWSDGERLSFAVFWVLFPTKDCRVHTYTVNGRTRGAFKSDCASWEDSDYDILLFNVELKNQMHRPVPFNLRNFILVGRDGRSFGPVNVRTKATYPPYFLPETGKIPARGELSGWLTFDGRVLHLVPAKVSYVD